MAKKNMTVHNKEIARGINALGRSASRARRGVWAIKKKAKTAPAAKAVKTNMVGRWYSADDVAKPLPSRKTSRQTRLKAGLVAGSIVIILSGRFKGKRAVFLKQLASGLLLVTGPFKVNGVPLRRINQAYVIATSTTVDASKVDVSKIDDAFFAYEKVAKKCPDGSAFFNEEKVKTSVSAERKAAQKKVDSALLPAIKKTPLIGAYLNAKFSLKNGQAPHLMKF